MKSALYLFAAVMLIGLASAASSDILVVNAENCGFDVSSVTCSDVVTVSCDVAVSYTVSETGQDERISSVEFVVGSGSAQRRLDAELVSGDNTNGSWEAEFTVDSSFETNNAIDLKNVVTTTSSQVVCDGSLKPVHQSAQCYTNFSVYRAVNNCVCSIVTSSQDNGDNTATYTVTKSLGCSDFGTSEFTDLSDSCTPSWVVDYGVCNYTYPAGYGNIEGVMEKAYLYDENGCFAQTGLSEDLIRPPDQGIEVACVLSGWTNEGRDVLQYQGQIKTDSSTQVNPFNGDYTTASLGITNVQFEALHWDVDNDGEFELIVFDDSSIYVYDDQLVLENTIAAGGTITGQPALVGATNKGYGYNQYQLESFVTSTSAPILVVPVSTSVIAFNVTSGSSLETVETSVDDFTGVSCFENDCYTMDQGGVAYKLSYASGSWTTSESFLSAEGGVPVIQNDFSPIINEIDNRVIWPRKVLRADGNESVTFARTDYDLGTVASDGLLVANAKVSGGEQVNLTVKGASLSKGDGATSLRTLVTFEETVIESGTEYTYFSYYVPFSGSSPKTLWKNTRTTNEEGVSNPVGLLGGGWAVEINFEQLSVGASTQPFNNPTLTKSISTGTTQRTQYGTVVDDDLGLAIGGSGTNAVSWNVNTGSQSDTFNGVNFATETHGNVFDNQVFVRFATAHKCVDYDVPTSLSSCGTPRSFGGGSELGYGVVDGYFLYYFTDYAPAFFFPEDQLYRAEVSNLSNQEGMQPNWTTGFSNSQLDASIPSWSYGVNSPEQARIVHHDATNDFVLTSHFFIDGWSDFATAVNNAEPLTDELSFLAYNFDYNDPKFVTEGGQLIEVNTWDPYSANVSTGSCTDFVPFYWNAQSFILGMDLVVGAGGFPVFAYCDMSDPGNPVVRSLSEQIEIPARTYVSSGDYSSDWGSNDDLWDITVFEQDRDYDGSGTVYVVAYGRVSSSSERQLKIFAIDTTRQEVETSGAISQLVSILPNTNIGQTSGWSELHDVSQIGVGQTDDDVSLEIFTSTGTYDLQEGIFDSHSISSGKESILMPFDVNGDTFLDVLSISSTDEYIRLLTTTPTVEAIVGGTTTEILNFQCSQTGDNEVTLYAAIKVIDGYFDNNYVRVGIDKGDGAGFTTFPPNSDGEYIVSYSYPGSYEITFGLGYDALTQFETCEVDLDFQQEVECTLGADGEFNFPDRVTNHGWSVLEGSNIPIPAGGVVRVRDGSGISYAVSDCGYDQVTIEYNVYPNDQEVWVSDGSTQYGMLFDSENGLIKSESSKTLSTYTVSLTTPTVVKFVIDNTNKQLKYYYDDTLINVEQFTDRYLLTGVQLFGLGTFDYVRVTTGGSKYTDTIVVGPQPDLDGTPQGVLQLQSCSNTVGTSYPHIGAYCDTVSNGQCSVTQLADAVRWNADCYKEAYNYCSYVTYPSTVNSQNASYNAATFCYGITQLQGFSDKIFVPFVSEAVGLLTSGNVFVYVLIGVLIFVMIVPLISRFRR